MKAKSLFGIQFIEDKNLKDSIFSHFTQWKSKELSEIIDGIPFGDILQVHLSNEFGRTRDLLSEDKCRQFLITGEVLDMCEKIRVKEPFEVEWLSQVKDGKRQLNFGDTFIRYEKKDGVIFAMGAKNKKLENGQHYLSYTFFKFDLNLKRVSGKSSPDDFDVKPPIPHATFDDFAKKTLYQLIMYMELADIEEIFVSPGRSHGVKKSPNKLFNDSHIPMTVVTTGWNKIIRTTGFDVNGFFKKQHWGPKNQYRKLIWIDPFHKEGYNLGARGQPAPPRKLDDDNNSLKKRR